MTKYLEQTVHLQLCEGIPPLSAVPKNFNSN